MNIEQISNVKIYVNDPYNFDIHGSVYVIDILVSGSVSIECEYETSLQEFKKSENYKNGLIKLSELLQKRVINYMTSIFKNKYLSGFISPEDIHEIADSITISVVHQL